MNTDHRGATSGLRELLDGIGDRLCCAAISVASLAGFAWVVWYVATMTGLR
jgi:hypothetical protein